MPAFIQLVGSYGVGCNLTLYGCYQLLINVNVVLDGLGRSLGERNVVHYHGKLVVGIVVTDGDVALLTGVAAKVNGVLLRPAGGYEFLRYLRKVIDRLVASR